MNQDVSMYHGQFHPSIVNSGGGGGGGGHNGALIGRFCSANILQHDYCRQSTSWLQHTTCLFHPVAEWHHSLLVISHHEESCYLQLTVSVHLTFKQQNSCPYISIIRGWCDYSCHLHQSLWLLSVRQVFFLMSPGYIKHQRINSVFSLSLAVDYSHPYIDISMAAFFVSILYTHTHTLSRMYFQNYWLLTHWRTYLLSLRKYKGKFFVKNSYFWLI